MKLKDINNIQFNPIFTSKLIHYFLSGANVNRNMIKLEIIYCVLPILYKEIPLCKLNKMNVRSNISTFLTDEIKLEFIDLNSKVKEYNTITNEALIVLSNQIKLEFNEFISIDSENTLNKSTDKNPILHSYYKGAYNLGVIFSSEEYKNLFCKL